MLSLERLATLLASMSKQVCITVRTLKSEFYSNQFSFDDNLKASDVVEGSVKRSQDSIETRRGLGAE